MGSTGKVNQDDFPAGDIDNNAPAFVGQSSELKWIQRLKGELNPQSKANRSKAQPDAPVISEDMDTSIIGHQIDPFSLPLKSTADATVNAYFSTVHLSFPVLDKAEFMTKYEQLFNSMDPESYEDRTFISIIQLVLAIGAVHAHFVDAEWSGDQRDHMLYFAQARVVAVDNGILNDRCFLGQVQVFGLSGFYLLVTDQLNRYARFSHLKLGPNNFIGLGI